MQKQRQDVELNVPEENIDSCDKYRVLRLFETAKKNSDLQEKAKNKPITGNVENIATTRGHKKNIAEINARYNKEHEKWQKAEAGRKEKQNDNEITK